MSRPLYLFCLALIVVCGSLARAADPPEAADPVARDAVDRQLSPEWSVALAKKIRPAVAVVTVEGRDGRREGLGTGFVISADGLIATNRHVIGDGRAIKVRLADGREFVPQVVHATDRQLDLAVLRIEAKELTALELADSDQVQQGEPVLAFGNPLGLEHSVATGVISGARTIDGLPLLQVAIPIERGNSGGPLVDRDGRVVGIMTMKSATTSNLGFALKSNDLKALVDRPNPVPMERWLTIGALDPAEWQSRLGAAWRQRAGRVQARGSGRGFGGRSLCVWQHVAPDEPFEIEVTVKLDNEEGAAGLAFAISDDDHHYGFYPSNGRLRMSHFDGPDVTSWQVLHERATPHYRPGEWNRLRVRIGADSIRGFVNDQLVIDHAGSAPRGGRVGLAAFRGTEAEFKQFRVGRKLDSLGPSTDLLDRLTGQLDKLPADMPAENPVLRQLHAEPAAAALALRRRAEALREQAERFDRLATQVVHRQTIDQLVAEVEKDDGSLLRAALLVARLDNDELDIDGYIAVVRRMSREIKARLPGDASEAQRLAELNKYLYDELGYHGARHDYYNRANSYLNEVIDDREGLPITLAVLYIELADGLGVRVAGVPLPGHFVACHEPAEGTPQLIDPFERGAKLSRDDAAKIVNDSAGVDLEERHLAAASTRSIIARMLHNLLGVADREKDSASMLRYADALVALLPDSGQERVARCLLRMQNDDSRGAMTDVEWLLDRRPDDIDLDRVEQLREFIQRQLAR